MKVDFPQKLLENELIQRQVLDITFVRRVLGKTAYAEGGKHKEIQVVLTADKVFHKTLRSGTTVGRATKNERATIFSAEEDQKQHIGEKGKNRGKNERDKF